MAPLESATESDDPPSLESAMDFEASQSLLPSESTYGTDSESEGAHIV